MGSPRIDGGMTNAERQAALLEERKYQDEQEEKRRLQAIADEAEREERARMEQERLAAEEAQRIADINAAEQAVIDESEAQKKVEEEKKPKLSTAFSSALLKGLQYNQPESKQ